MNPHDPQFKHFLERLEGVRLSDDARARITTTLKEYAAFHPVREAQLRRFKKQVPFIGSVITFLNQPKKIMPALLIMFTLLVGGGTSVAANGAVPGDLLYPIKIEVNEKIEAALAVTTKSEASLQAKFAKERLEEAQTLAADGELTAENAAALGLKLKAHKDSAESLSTKLEARGDLKTSADVRSTIEGTFRSYADVLSGLNAGVSGNNGVSLISDIRTYINATTDAKATTSAELSAELKASINDTIDYADTAIERAEDSLADVEGKVSAGAYAEMNAKLEAAIAAHAAAETALTAEQYTKAYQEARTAIRLATQVQTKATSMGHLKVKVEAAGLSLDSLLEANTDAKVKDETTNSSKTSTPAADNTPQKEDHSNAPAKQEVEEEPKRNTTNVETSQETTVEVDEEEVNFGQSLRATLGL